MTKSALPLLLLIPVLSACASSGVPRSAPPSAGLPAGKPSTYSARGLENVIGATQGRLEKLFGTPRLVVPEPPALKLQFTGPACILDAYLYPGEGGGERRVTHIDARNSTGAEVDRAACVAALQR